MLLKVVKEQYRKQLLATHPDKGGSKSQFQEVRIELENRTAFFK